MDESTNSENNSMEPEKPVQVQTMEDDIKFPPLPEPTDKDFEDDVTDEEKNHYLSKFKDLNSIVNFRLHCSACDRHLGCAPRNETRIRCHPMLRTLMCHTCHTFYNSGEFEKGDDGSELYCRWCGQGGQVYCCSDCPHVFCAKCIKRNFGMPMIKQIEDTEDWKCFKCNTKALWDLRAICWAVLRYCDLKNKITHETQDKTLKEAYQKDCDLDHAECCRNKNRRKEKQEDKKPKHKEETKDIKKTPTLPKGGSTIQVKKFASINLDELVIKHDPAKKTAQKRPASPKNKPIYVKNPVAIGNKISNPIILHPVNKKMRMTAPPMMAANIRFNNERKQINSYTRIRPKPPNAPVVYNGYSGTVPFNMLVSDNINLSLESLTQGLDMATVAGMGNNVQDDDVVCTPDFPLEALCEVQEDNNDDDVQCIGPVVTSKAPPPLVPRSILNPVNEQPDNNIIQMTENDVTVNAATGGLKFRVDPQTLSSNKMYRLPDGRIFAINANPNMPGGYSATIVAVTDENATKLPPKGITYAAKLSSVVSPMATPPPLKAYRVQDNRNKSKRSTPKSAKVNRGTETPNRDCDLNVPIEWYRYNLIDAVDALEYSLLRLNKLKQEATTMHLRTRSVNEMRNLHRRLECVLNTSTSRFNEIRENINKEFKQYLLKKMGTGGGNNTSEDDDDVEILPDDNDDPIFIDENSLDSTANVSQEVDLTVMGSSDHNDSNEKSLEKNDAVQILDPLCSTDNHDSDDNGSILPDNGPEILKHALLENEKQTNDKNHNDKNFTQDQHIQKNDANDIVNSEIPDIDVKKENKVDEINGDDTNSADVKHTSENPVEDKIDEDVLKEDMNSQSSCDKKIDDSEMSEEMIENLLNDDTGDTNDKENTVAMDVS